MICCPECGAMVSLESTGALCEGGHSFSYEAGVYHLLSKEFELKLTKFLAAFDDYRKPLIKNLTPKLFRQLPYVNLEPEVWKLRQLDVELIQSLKLSKGAKVLDLGSWNGWLANRLAEMGAEVTAVDYFIHERDGLEAKKYYDNNWLSIQMNLNELQLFQAKFDLIVVNRCLPYFENLEKTVKDCKRLLNPGGVILFTGVNYFQDASHIRNNLKKVGASFQGKYNIPFLFSEYSGFVQKKDLVLLKAEGFRLKVYSTMKLKTIAAKIFKAKASYFYAIFNSGVQ